MKLDFLPRLQMMPIYYPDSCEGDEELVDHVCSVCDDDTEKARVRGVAFIKDTYALATPAVAAGWLTGIESRDIVVIPDVTGSFNGGEPVETTGYGDRATRVTGYTFELTYRDKDYAANAAFYNGLTKRQNYRVAFRSENLTHISDGPVSVFAKQEITDSLDDDVVWTVTVRFKGRSLLVPFATPAGVFRCYSLEAPAEPAP